jgi:pimeloyl-ACP methyl ester carboxylesterase
LRNSASTNPGRIVERVERTVYESSKSPDMDWINKNLFPFKPNYIKIDGYRLYYIDEGSGAIILFVHGTPEWSFAYRDLVKGLSETYRCIAIDHLGFGLSDKPVDADYTTKKHASRLETFIEQLQLQNINIVANDFGGSIALSYAIGHPGNVNRVCLFNTWMWSLARDRHYSWAARLMRTWIGKLLYRQFNFPVTVIMPRAYGNRSKLTKEIHRHYKEPLSEPAYRNGAYAFAKEMLDASGWWDGLWANIYKIKDKPFLIFWGMKDRFILPKELDRWANALTDVRVIRFAQAGHFVQEEEPGKMIRELKEFFR